MNVTHDIAGTGCGVCTLSSVARQSPKETLVQFLKSHGGTRSVYVISKGTYVAVPNLKQIHVIFGGPDMSTLKPENAHYSSRGSCGAFAAFIRENSLGSVIETPPKHNPYHGERKPGEGDVIVYVWSPDNEALEKWALDNPI